MSLKGWANLLLHDKVDPSKMVDSDVERYTRLLNALADKLFDGFGAYANRQKCRKTICETAIDLGIDLMAFKHARTKKVLIGRGLLDIWTEVYKTRFGSAVGTAAWQEDKRRVVVTRLAKQRQEEKRQ